ncbi:unnamed protein product [Victoria cruziana]
MEELLRKVLPAGAPIPDDDQLDVSFAVEYEGPPVAYDLPKVIPVDVDRIPVASQVSTSLPGTVPVVQPVFSAGIPVRSVSWVSMSGSKQRDVVPSGKSREAVADDRASPTSVMESSSIERVGDDGASAGVDECSVEGGFSNLLTNSGEDLSSAPMGWGSDDDGSVRSSPILSSGASSWKGDDQGPESVSSFRRSEEDEELSGDVKKPQTVTFQEQDPSLSRNGGLRDGASGSRLKKGTCHRCLRGNWLMEKEVCLVCNAKYCSNCVLRAMGSMPEGRKCVGCIGYPIDETKRESLGKCSRLLRRLLSSLEVREIMKAEKSCEANQLQPESVFINGKQLSPDEMAILVSCGNPPTKMKPGRYWYDKVSGLWGKEGSKPHKIITPHLNVGGSLMFNASNGNTNVYINGREITRTELRMLQWAGVQCAGNPHFWVNADGSYQEEGQKNIKGHIWGKAGTRLVCSVLSLPTPCKTTNFFGDEVNGLPIRTLPEYFEQRVQKILLIGLPGAGTSALFKQAKLLYKPNPFSEDERQNLKLMIQSNVYRYLCVLLEGRERFEEEYLNNHKLRNALDTTGMLKEADGQNIYAISTKMKVFSDWLLKIMISGELEVIFPAATREYAPIVEELWRDPAIQATYARRRELPSLPSAASYFLERVVDISRSDYEPSDMDIVSAEGHLSNGLAFMEFSFPQLPSDDNIDDADQADPFARYQLIRVHAKGLKESRKWLEMFEDVRIVVFCVAVNDYDQSYEDGEFMGENKMIVSKKVFESMILHPSFDQAAFLLVLTKIDLFEQKIYQVPLRTCDWFDDFNPPTSSHRPSSHLPCNASSNNTSLPQQAYQYIAVKFKRLFSSLTGRKLYVSQTDVLKACTVDETLRYAREVVKWDEDKLDFCGNEYSVYSTDMVSF